MCLNPESNEGWVRDKQQRIAVELDSLSSLELEQSSDVSAGKAAVPDFPYGSRTGAKFSGEGHTIASMLAGLSTFIARMSSSENPLRRILGTMFWRMCP